VTFRLSTASDAREDRFYDPAALLSDVVRLSDREGGGKARGGGRYLRSWYAPRALAELLSFRERIEGTAYPELWQIVLSRSARSARLARHDDLDFPAEPATSEYFCHKHRRVCRPVGEADKFLRRYVRDAVQRVQEFADVRSTARVDVLHGDARVLDPPGPVDLVLTSPPYPGLIDYHEQHAYAYELLGLERRDQRGDRPRSEGLLRRHCRRPRPARAERCGAAARSWLSSTTAVGSTTGSLSAADFAWKTGCSATSTGAPGVARASTTKKS
jgi:hypothetical protein